MSEAISREVKRSAAAGDAVALARVLVATPSVNPELEAGGTGEEAIARQCAEWLDSWGYEVVLEEVSSGRYNVLARRGAGPRSLLLNGHLDTVGVEGMTVPAFEGRVREGRLEGRGACDMKGGVAAILSAAASLREDDLGGRLSVVLTADEEHASLGMQAVVADGARADAAVVCEPTSLAVAPAHKGFLWVEARFRGRAAHGSRPEEGVDSIRHAGRFLSALDGYETRLKGVSPHALLGHGTVHAGTIRGGSAPSVYPERCTLVLERRTLPSETPAQVMAELEAVARELRASLPDLELELVAGLDRPGTEVPREAPLVQGLLAAAERVGIEPRIDAMSAWVDAAFLNDSGVPAVCFGPGSIAQAHSDDEWAPLDEIERCARALDVFARTFLSGGGAPGA